MASKKPVEKYLKITLSEEGTTHSGYCSDPLDIVNYKHKDTIIDHDFPHKESIISSEIIDDEEDLSHDSILNDIRIYVNKKYKKNNQPCNKGSGYCSCSFNTSLVTIKICLKYKS